MSKGYMKEIDALAAEILQQINKALRDKDFFYRHLLMREGEQTDCVLRMMNTKTLRDVVSVLADLRGIISHDVLDKKAVEDLKIKKARLRLDQDKAGGGVESDTDTGIAYIAPLDDGKSDSVELPIM